MSVLSSLSKVSEKRKKRDLHEKNVSASRLGGSLFLHCNPLNHQNSVLLVALQWDHRFFTDSSISELLGGLISVFPTNRPLQPFITHSKRLVKYTWAANCVNSMAFQSKLAHWRHFAEGQADSIACRSFQKTNIQRHTIGNILGKNNHRLKIYLKTIKEELRCGFAEKLTNLLAMCKWTRRSARRQKPQVYADAIEEERLVLVLLGCCKHGTGFVIALHSLSVLMTHFHARIQFKIVPWNVRLLFRVVAVVVVAVIITVWIEKYACNIWNSVGAHANTLAL